jgi:hypothetical protein
LADGDFSKVLKHHLKVKTFVGTIPKVMKIQICTAAIAVLILGFLHPWSQIHWFLSNLKGQDFAQDGNNFRR